MAKWERSGTKVGYQSIDNVNLAPDTTLGLTARHATLGEVTQNKGVVYVLNRYDGILGLKNG